MATDVRPGPGRNPFISCAAQGAVNTLFGRPRRMGQRTRRAVTSASASIPKVQSMQPGQDMQTQEALPQLL